MTSAHNRRRQQKQTHKTRKANEARNRNNYRDGKGHRRVLGSRNKAKRKQERRMRRAA